MSSSRRFLAVLAGFGLVALALLLATAFVTDPRGIVAPAFPNAPRLCAGGSSLEPRELKPFLALPHQPREILVGNSRVHNGFSAADAAEFLGRPAVNLAVNAIRMDEAAALIRHAWTVAPVERVWLGIDYVMFTQPASTTIDPPAAMDARLYALRYGVADPAAIRSAVEYLAGGEACGRPHTTPLGFVHPVPPASRQARKAYRRSAPLLLQRRIDFDAAIPADQRARIRRERHALLRQLIVEARARGVRMVLFIAPSHPELTERLGDTPLLRDHESWRREMAALAAAEAYDGLVFLDVSQNAQVAAAARGPECAEGISPACPFYDFTHYSPWVGRRILERGTAADQPPSSVNPSRSVT